MVEHLTQKQFEAFRRRQLGVAELLSVSDHLGECEACRRRTESATNDDAAFFALRSEVFGEAAEVSSSQLVPAHLTPEQTALYVEGNLSGGELRTISDHLTSCEPCALAVEDLRAFRDQVAPSLGREYHPAPASPPTEGWWSRTLASLPAFFLWPPKPAFGAALAILLLAATGWLIWRMPRGRGPQPELVVSPAPRPQQQEVVVSPTPGSEPAPVPAPPQPASAPLLARLNDGGGQLTLDEEGRLSGADGLPPAYRSMLKEALATRRIERSSQLTGLARPPSPLMSSDGQGGEFSVIGPIGKVLLTERPTFRWSPMKGATGYVVEVYDGKFNPVAASPQLTGNSWVPPRSLPRGAVYAWQVRAVKDGQTVTSPRPPAPQARFRILDGAKASELARARRAYPASHLTLGLLYAEAGLLDEAERELRRLRKANPDSELARRLLSQVQALRRRSE